MTAEDLQSCQARALAAAGRLRLPFRSRIWKGQSGEFQGAGVGSSLDFQDHRSYVPGDDPRHINWQAYARTGNYSMKLYREEVRPVIDVVLDASESMFFDPQKAARTAELLIFTAESSARAGASVTIHAVRGHTHRYLPLETIRSSRWFEESRAIETDDPSAPPDLSRIPLRGNAIRVFISDLLFPGDPEPILRHLSHRQGSPILFTPFLKTEAQPDWDGHFEFIDAENQSRHHHRIEPAILERYRKSYANHFALWKHATLRNQARMARVACEPDLSTALSLEAVPSGALEIAH